MEQSCRECGYEGHVTYSGMCMECAYDVGKPCKLCGGNSSERKYSGYCNDCMSK